MATTVLVDGDILLYNAGHAIQRVYYKLINKQGAIIKVFSVGTTLTEIRKNKDPNTPAGSHLRRCVRVQPVYFGFNILNNKIISLQRLGDHMEIYLSGPSEDNFRKKIATTAKYKAGRPTRPVHYMALRNFLIGRHGAIIAHGEEADDLLVRRHQQLGSAAILCSVDKDMLQSPGVHYNMKKLEMTSVDADTAKLNLIVQIIGGDTSDNVPGLKHFFRDGARIGAVKIRNWVEENKEMCLTQKYWYRNLPYHWFKDGVGYPEMDKLYEEQRVLLTCGEHRNDTN